MTHDDTPPPEPVSGPAAHPAIRSVVLADPIQPCFIVDQLEHGIPLADEKLPAIIPNYAPEVRPHDTRHNI